MTLRPATITRATTWKAWTIPATTWGRWIIPAMRWNQAPPPRPSPASRGGRKIRWTISAMTWIRAETSHDRRGHPLVCRQPVPGADAGRADRGLGRRFHAAHAAGRDSGPVRRTGDRQDQLPGPGTAGG